MNDPVRHCNLKHRLRDLAHVLRYPVEVAQGGSTCKRNLEFDEEASYENTTTCMVGETNP